MNQSGRYLLDTNIVIALFSDETAVQERAKKAEMVALAPPIIGELYYGARKSDRVSENRRRIDGFVQQNAFFLVIWKPLGGTESSKIDYGGRAALSPTTISGSLRLLYSAD